MKAITHGLLPIALLVAVIGGVSYFAQFTRSPVAELPGTVGSSTQPAPQLKTSPLVAVWDANEPTYAQEFAIGTEGHRDFWLANAHPIPLSVSCTFISCQCAGVQYATVPAEEVRRWQAATPTATASADAVGVAVTAPGATGPSTGELKFTTLKRGDSTEMPAADGNTPAIGVVRLSWKAESMGPKRLGGAVEVSSPQGRAFAGQFEVPIVVSGPVLVSTPTFALGDLKPGDHRPLELFCWSPFLDTYPLTVKEAEQHPCIELLPPEPLTPEELKTTIPAMLKAKHPEYPATRMKSGYRVRAIVHERRGDAQFDLGPLSRKLVLDAGPDRESSVTITALVRGNLRVGVPEDNDQIKLGSFRNDRPHEKVVPVTCDDAAVRLKLGDVTPAAVNVELKEQPAVGGRKEWILRVEIPPGAVLGPLPNTSGIVLEATGPSGTRRMRIPLIGTGFSR